MVNIILSKNDLENMLERAAEAGAARALKDIGLDHESADNDVFELLTLLEAWRLAKRTAWQSLIRFFVLALLTLIVAGVYVKVKG